MKFRKQERECQEPEFPCEACIYGSGPCEYEHDDHQEYDKTPEEISKAKDAKRSISVGSHYDFDFSDNTYYRDGRLVGQFDGSVEFAVATAR